MTQPAEKGKYIELGRSVLTVGLAFVLNFAIQILLIPYIVAHVGTDGYGFVSLAKNFADYAAILATALNAFATRHIAVAYHQKDLDSANRFYTSAFYGNSLLAALVMSAAAVMIVFLQHLLNIPQNLQMDVKLLFTLIFCNFAVVTLSSVFQAGPVISSRMSLSGVYKVLSYAAEALLLIAAYRLLVSRVYYVGAGLLLSSLVMAYGNLRITQKYTPDLRISRHRFSWSVVAKLLKDGLWNAMNQAGEMLNNGLDLMICNLMLSPLQMGQLAITKTLHSMMHGIFVVISPAFHPMYLRSYAKEDKKQLIRDLRLAMKLSGMFANIMFAGFAALGGVFLLLWLPTEETETLYRLTLFNGLTLIAAGPMFPLYYVYTLTVKQKIPSLITLAGGILNVVSMYFLLKYTSTGIYAIVWTTVVVSMSMNYITNPLYMAHVLRLPLGTFFPGIIRNVISAVIMTAAFFLLRTVYTPASWLTLILCVPVCILIGTPMHLAIVCSREDWAMIRKWLARLRNR